MFRTPRGYGNLNDLQAQLTPNFGYAGRLRDLTEQLSPEVKIQRDRRAEPIMRTMEIKTPPPTDVYDAISGMDAMKKGGKVKKYKVKQSNKNIAIAKNVVKVYYDRPKRRAAKRKPRVSRRPVEEKKVIVQPSQVRPQFVTNVMGGNPGQPIALNEFTKRLGVLEDQLNKPKVLNKMVEEEKKVEIPQFVDTIPDAELQAIEQQIEQKDEEDQKHEDEPGVINVIEDPKLDALKNLFDTGVDFTYTRNNKQQVPTQYTERIYITPKNKIKMNNTKGTLKSISQVLRGSEFESLVKHLEERGISGYPRPDEVEV